MTENNIEKQTEAPDDGQQPAETAPAVSGEQAAERPESGKPVSADTGEAPSPQPTPEAETPEDTVAETEPAPEEQAEPVADSTEQAEPEEEAADETAEPAADSTEQAEPAEKATEEEADGDEPTEAEEPVAEKPVIEDTGPPDHLWYVIHAHSGHENKVKQSLENRIRQEGLEDEISRVLVPSEEVAEVKGGKKRITNRKIFPGYVLVRMKLSQNTWYLVRSTPGVTGFIGSGKDPTPLEAEEIKSIFEQMRGEQKKPKPKVEFEKDETVKIIEGPFANFMGCVEEVNPERGTLKVLVEIFERLTPVELEFWQVEKT